ncbi:AbrB/MazE/SpoVT family DNA-binding domain-containing protein [Companilactobacillus jidongensis]|uniref:AbrB/MazE/SpoVT family DNA-binding domain-containing protein n=1 Tax=Companilactobacillus jidongensis TaxID=2486006 RepID=UPI000F7A5AC6|nr:antitoxin [Companilactobacillus jidongensis]
MKEILGTYKTRKNGNSMSITVPKSAGISENESFSLQKENGNLIYKPLKEENNPWKNGHFKNHDFRNDMNKLEFEVGSETPVGKENIF